MDIRKLKQNADETLASASYSPNRLVLIHTTAALALSLVLMALSEALSGSMGSAGGLSGMGTQSVLATAQVVLQMVSVIITPFWTAGMVHAALGYARQKPVTPGSLLEGFRRWKPILSSTLLIGLRYIGVAFIATYLAGQLIMFTPFAVPLYKASMELSTNPTADITALLGDSLYAMSAVYMGLFLIVFALLALPVFYRYRMVPYLIMDAQGMGGFRAMLTSREMMRKKRMWLFKVDLSFWWFYLAEIGIGALCCGHLLPNLPMSEDVAYWVFQLAAMLGQLALYYFAKPKLEVTYARCYEALLNPEPEVVNTVPKAPKKHPWTY